MSGAKAVVAQRKPWKPEQLPPFPAVATNALRALTRNQTALQQLYEMVRPEPMFSSEILRLANSPLFAFPKEITSVLSAFMLMGFDRVRSVLTTVGMRQYMGSTPTAAALACWRHTLACAVIAEEAAKWSAMDKDFAHTAAIMHDIGRVSLISAFPNDYPAILAAGAKEPRDLLQREKEAFGLDHCEAGARLAQSWSLPKLLGEVASGHHGDAGENQDAVGIVGQSCLLADSIGFGITSFSPVHNYEQILSHFSEAARQRFPATAGELAVLIHAKIQSISG